jgi:hypothetical protein
MITPKSLFRISATLLLGCVSSLRCAAQRPAEKPSLPPKPITYVAPTKENYLRFADETEAMLRRDVLGMWFPRTVDNENGGFHSDFNREWQATRSGGKFSVFQGRMTWVGAAVAIRRPELQDQFLSRHGTWHRVSKQCFMGQAVWRLFLGSG